jgi:hypothetical protein
MLNDYVHGEERFSENIGFSKEGLGEKKTFF